MGEEKRTLSCTDCGVLNCHKRNASYPEFCLTEKLTDEDIAETTALYEDEENRKVSVISAEIEGEFYGKYTRVDEIIEFAKRMGYKKIGIATCVGLDEKYTCVTGNVMCNPILQAKLLNKAGTLLGETTAETKVILTQLRDSMMKEADQTDSRRRKIGWK